MFGNALVMMLYNTIAETYHPILYFESPLPGNPDNLTRYKSKGHRTAGFIDREDAVKTIQTEIVDRLPDCNIKLELDGNIEWDGEGIPADIQIR